MHFMYLRFCLFTTVLVLRTVAQAQEVDYTDVGVIVNLNSDDSQAIGAYFVAARNIPAENVIEVNVPVTEQITPQEFADLQEQVEQHLLNNGLVDQLNYLVTTKGVPLRSGTTACNTSSNFSGCKSIDSQLCLILGPLTSAIGANPTVQNPFRTSTSDHSRANNGIYLVTRLDGFKLEDVQALIERSGPNVSVVKEDALIVADAAWAGDPGALSVFVEQFESITTPLEQNGWSTLTDVSPTVVTEIEDLFGYISVHDAPALNEPEFTWMAGAIAMEWWNFSAFSFDPSTTTPEHRRIAERVAEGVIGARGNVTAQFGTPNYHAYHTWVRYTDTSYHFNLAESFYAGIMTLNDSYVVIGDPKTSIVLTSNTSISDTDRSVNVVAYPNPNNGNFIISSSDPFQSYRITDMLGRTIPSASGTWSDRLSIDLSEQPEGIYVLQGSTRNGKRFTIRVIVQR
jgi:uncharacterized protein (TIGR03790 family)